MRDRTYQQCGRKSRLANRDMDLCTDNEKAARKIPRRFCFSCSGCGSAALGVDRIGAGTGGGQHD
ncbi:hypothetical protein, partial [Mesorhizobium sp. P5_C1]